MCSLFCKVSGNLNSLYLIFKHAFMCYLRRNTPLSVHWMTVNVSPSGSTTDWISCYFIVSGWLCSVESSSLNRLFSFFFFYTTPPILFWGVRFSSVRRLCNPALLHFPSLLSASPRRLHDDDDDTAHYDVLPASDEASQPLWSQSRCTGNGCLHLQCPEFRGPAGLSPINACAWFFHNAVKAPQLWGSSSLWSASVVLIHSRSTHRLSLSVWALKYDLEFG